MRDDAVGDVGPEDSLGLSGADDFPDEIQIVDQMLMGKLGDESRTLTNFGLHDDGQIAVSGERFEVEASEHFELGARGFYALNFSFRAVEEAAEGSIDGFAQNVVLIFEIEIDSAVGNSSSRGYLRDACVEESMLGDDLDSGIENAQVLVSAAGWVGLR